MTDPRNVAGRFTELCALLPGTWSTMRRTGCTICGSLWITVFPLVRSRSRPAPSYAVGQAYKSHRALLRAVPHPVLVRGTARPPPWAARTVGPHALVGCSLPTPPPPQPAKARHDAAALTGPPVTYASINPSRPQPRCPCTSPTSAAAALGPRPPSAYRRPSRAEGVPTPGRGERVRELLRNRPRDMGPRHGSTARQHHSPTPPLPAPPAPATPALPSPRGRSYYGVITHAGERHTEPRLLRRNGGAFRG